MKYSLQFIGRRVKPVDLALLESLIPSGLIRQILDSSGRRTRRFRKICLDQIVWLMIAIHLWMNMSIDEVYNQITGSLLAPIGSALVRAGSGAIAYRRDQLGVAPMVALFHGVCQPIATAAIRGAMLAGLRVMAIDGQVLDVADTPENDRYFGRPTTDRGFGAYPQARVVSLAECGTHTIIDAGIWPYRTSERIGGRRLLRSVGEGALVMVDCGMYSFEWIRCILNSKAHALARLAKHIHCEPVQILEDGSQLVDVHQRDARGKLTGQTLRLRLITYTITDPNLPGHNKIYRLLTTLLDPRTASAHELAVAYHERWEIELAFDERETHLHPARPTLRSKKPLGVLQEIYGWLIAHYVIRRIMVDAALRADIDPDRLSFVHAVRVIQTSLVAFQNHTVAKCAELYDIVLAKIVRFPLPTRRLRIWSRVVKQKMSNFKLKRSKHHQTYLKQTTYTNVIALI